MTKYLLPVLAVVLAVVGLTATYFFFSFGPDIDRIFLSVSTFLFSIFTGFFISRQASRYNRVREGVTSFDGQMSSIYRASGHISSELQNEVGRVISGHYQRIFESKQWNIHLIEKSDTLTKLHDLMDKHVVEKEVTKLSNQSIGAIIKGLAGCQGIRKRLVALQEERIPSEQWILVIFFAGMLLTTVSMIPSAGSFYASLLKAAFTISIFSVLLILFKLNNLIYSEDIMGEHSASDVLEIIEGSK